MPEKVIHYIGSFDGELPKEANQMDVAILSEKGSTTGLAYVFDKGHWIPLLTGDIPESLVRKGEKYNRRLSIEEIDMFAGNMIENICLEDEGDNETLHCDCDDVLIVVLKSLGLTKTLKAYKEASKKFWYA